LCNAELRVGGTLLAEQKPGVTADEVEAEAAREPVTKA
jgi:hypothetical protein